MVKHFLDLEEFSNDEILSILKNGQKLKNEQKDGKKHHLLEGKTLAMIFEKPSTRTRVSFDVGMYQLGGLAINLSSAGIGLGKRESVGDVAKTLSGYCDAVMIRTFEHSIIEEFAKNSSVPVINGLTNSAHPCQVMADALTILEVAGKLEGQKLVYMGDGNNVAKSLISLAKKTK